MTKAWAWAQAALLRQGLYRFVGGALMPPSRDSSATLRSAAAYLDGMGTAGYAYHREWTLVTAELEALNGDEMSVDYVRLFASGSDFALCPPIESYYLGDVKGSAAGEIAALVDRRARSLGVAHTSAKMPPDHIVCEMEVMSVLCAREGAAWQADAGHVALAVLADEEAFLDAHPARWVTQFRDRVRKTAPSGFYRAMVEFAQAYVVHEVDYVRAARSVFAVRA